jgi:hypothetical protein
MCNCKGWDVLYGPNGVSIQQHFFRTYDDCGSVDRPLEEAAAECAEWHEQQARMWRDGTHPELQYYKS